MPLTRVTLMVPASRDPARRRHHGIGRCDLAIVDPIETLAPPQALLAEAITTFHSPSKLAAAAGVAIDMPTSNRRRAAMTGLLKYPKNIHDVPPWLDAGRFTQARAKQCDGCHIGCCACIQDDPVRSWPGAGETRRLHDGVKTA